MPRERTSTRAHRFALALTALAHGIAVLLVLASRDGRPMAPAARALQVTWIDPAPPAPVVDLPMPVPVEVRREASTTPPVHRAPAADAAVDLDPDPPPPAPSRPLSAVFIEQGKAIERSRDGADFVRNPLLDRASTLEAPVERIRMREPMSPARVVEGIGKLFGGADYETSPCPRIRRNIAALGTGGDGAALQEEVWRHQRFCE